MTIRGEVFFLTGLAAALAAGWAGLPRALDRRIPQPMEFSHKVHAEKAGQSCEDCHRFRADGSFAGIPPLDRCAGCHAAPMGATAAEKKFIAEYVTPGREPRWAAESAQPENVYFSHITHVKRGKVKCESCHGNVGSSNALPPVYVDRISGYSGKVMSMDACVECHRQRGLEFSCLGCHK